VASSGIQLQRGRCTVSRTRLASVTAASFVVGVMVGAGSLWLIQNNSPQLLAVAEENSQPSAPSAQTREAPNAITYDPDMVTIEYQVLTDGMSVTHLSYVDIVDGSPVMMESLGSPPPFTHVIQLPKDEDFDLRQLSVTGMGAATSTTTSCLLRVDGEVVARQSADGTYGLVNCSVSEGRDDT
jgi:hypothetical protein